LRASEPKAEPKAYRPGNPVVQLRVPKPTLAAIDSTRGDDTRSAWVLRLIDRELGGQQTAPAPEPAPQPSPAAITITGPGEPSPGVVCFTPGCFQRNTSKYGLRQLPLCPACAAALQGQDYKREVPETAVRAARRGAA
jgi:hypothetical protein